MIKTKKKYSTRYIILSGVLLIAVAGWFIGTKYLKNDIPKELTSIRVPIDMWPGNFWVVVANAKGFFEEEGLKAELIDVSANYNQWVEDFATQDVIDTMGYTVFDLVDKNIAGAELVAVLASDSSEGAEGIIAKKEFKELSDLRGKRIGVEVGSYLDYYLEVAMQSAGIDSDEYTKVNVPTESTVSSFDTEALDAAFLWEPQLSETVDQYNLHKIFNTANIRGLSLVIFAFKQEFIETNPETVQAFVRAWKRATDYILANKEEAYQLIAQTDFASNPNENFSFDEVQELAEQDPILDLQDNLKIFGFDSGFESLYGNLQFASLFLLKSKGLSSMPNTNNMLTDHFLRNVVQ